VREIAAYLALSFCAALRVEAQPSPVRISSTGQVLPSISDVDGARRAEAQLLGNQGTVDLLGQLLDFYNQRWQQSDLRASRLRVILWTIANHPDIDLAGTHDPRDLIVNPDDKQEYAQIRAAWLDQISRRPDNPQILVNAARCLRLTDREAAAGWIRQAMKLGSRGGFFVADLSDVYAAAICGVTGMNPWEGPTSVDPGETRSAFAREANEAARSDAELAGRTGWAVHLCSDGLAMAKLGSIDYDPIAERLLIQAAALDYPNPSKVPFLQPFYRDQGRKASGGLKPQWRIVEVSPAEQAKRLVEKSTSAGFTDPNFHAAVTIPVRLTIGIDGHVWKVEPAENRSIAGPAAAGSTLNWTYKPLRIDGQPVLVSTVVQVTVEPFIPSAPLGH
jgi:hypothetical protein